MLFHQEFHSCLKLETQVALQTNPGHASTGEATDRPASIIPP